MALTSGGGSIVGRGSSLARVVGAVTMVAVLSGSMAGCSFIFVKPPPPPEERSPIVRCTSSSALPAVDIIVGMLQIMRTMIAFSATDADYARSAIPRQADIFIGAGLTAVFLSSAVVGLSETKKCRELLADSGQLDRRPWVRQPLPRLTVRPISREQRKLEEAQEEAAVQARAAERARAARLEASRAANADAGAPAEMDAGPEVQAPVVVPAPPPERSVPPVRQRADPE
jgi:hypothetical protein